MPFYKIAQGTEFYVLWLSIYFFGVLTFYGFLIGGDGFYCQRECAFSDFQRFYFGTYRYFCYSYADAAFFWKTVAGAAVDQGAIIQQLLLKVLLPIVFRFVAQSAVQENS